MAEPRKILAPLASAFPLGRMIRLSGRRLIFPFYHMVSDDPPPHIRYLYQVKGTDAFKRDLDDLLRYFEPASPSLLLEGNLPKTTGKPSFILSFDDGLREVAEIIEPILSGKGIHAIVFLNNAFIGNKGLFFRYKISLLIGEIRNNPPGLSLSKDLASRMDLLSHDPHALIRGLLRLGYGCSGLIDGIAADLGLDFSHYLAEKKPYLDEQQVRKLTGKGFFIGGHSHSHTDFRHLGMEEQCREIISSAKDIRERFGTGYTFFSFPFSDLGVDTEVFHKIYGRDEKELDASFGTSGLKLDEPFPHFQRIPMEKTTDNAEKYLKTEYFYYLLKSVARRNRIRRKGSGAKGIKT